MIARLKLSAYGRHPVVTRNVWSHIHPTALQQRNNFSIDGLIGMRTGGTLHIIISHWLAVCIELWQKQHQPEETTKRTGVEQPHCMMHRHSAGDSEKLKIRKSACFNSIMLYSSHRGVRISSIICHHQSDPDGRTPLHYMPLEEFFRVIIYTFATMLFTN